MKETPITEWHRQHRAKVMEFGGYLMPIEYDGIMTEHRMVRDNVGMFDVSHMGEFWVRGDQSGAFLDYLVTNHPSELSLGQALYTPMCYPDGGTVDDLLIYRVTEDQFLMVVNAGNTEGDWEWVCRQKERFPEVQLKNASREIGLIAVQGPKATHALAHLVEDLDSIAYYHAAYRSLNDVEVWVSRTGYTGEDGFELYIPWQSTLDVWQQLCQLGIGPVGLGARDTLRLEARLPLYDHELAPTINPLEAGLGMFVKWDKGDFIGREALVQVKEHGLTRRLVGIEVGGGIARHGYPLYSALGGAIIGTVTSGTKSPTLNQAIALALVDPGYAKVGQPLLVQVRQRMLNATVVKTPFYRRSAP